MPLTTYERIEKNLGSKVGFVRTSREAEEIFRQNWALRDLPVFKEINMGRQSKLFGKVVGQEIGVDQ